MKKYWPQWLMILGVLIVFLGFGYDVSFAGVPYQDPTAEMQASYLRHAQIASVIGRIGGVVFGIGLLGWLIRRVAKSGMGRLLKIGIFFILAGSFLPAEPGMFRGDMKPEGWNPGFIMLGETGFGVVDSINTHYQYNGEPAYGWEHFSEDTLLPLLKNGAVLLAMLAILLAVIFPSLRTGFPKWLFAVVIFAGGACFILLCYPGYPPVGNGYGYYPGAYFLMASFPIIAFALIRGPAVAAINGRREPVK